MGSKFYKAVKNKINYLIYVRNFDNEKIHKI